MDEPVVCVHDIRAVVVQHLPQGEHRLRVRDGRHVPPIRVGVERA